MKMLQALVMEQKEELAKLLIEQPAAAKVRNVAVEQMMKARVKKSRVMDKMNKMAAETRTTPLRRDRRNREVRRRSGAAMGRCGGGRKKEGVKGWSEGERASLCRSPFPYL